MRTRLLAVLAVLAVGLIPAFAAAEEPPPLADPVTPVVLVDASAVVVGVTGDETGTTVELDVREAHDWLDGTETRTLSTGINGEHIVTDVTGDTVVSRNDEIVGLDALRSGTMVEAMLSTDCQPVDPTCAYTLLHVYIAAPKPKPANPGVKFELGFFPRLWHVRGAILALDRVEGRNVMNLDVRSLVNAPRRFRDEGVRLVNLDAYVIVPERTVITNEHGMRIAFGDLRVDSRVKVAGKFLRPSKWMTDRSGRPTPTLLARRVVVKVGPGH
jgi:hypothetical protein